MLQVIHFKLFSEEDQVTISLSVTVPASIITVIIIVICRCCRRRQRMVQAPGVEQHELLELTSSTLSPSSLSSPAIETDRSSVLSSSLSSPAILETVASSGSDWESSSPVASRTRLQSAKRQLNV